MAAEQMTIHHNQRDCAEGGREGVAHQDQGRTMNLGEFRNLNFIISIQKMTVCSNRKSFSRTMLTDIAGDRKDIHKKG